MREEKTRKMNNPLQFWNIIESKATLTTAVSVFERPLEGDKSICGSPFEN